MKRRTTLEGEIIQVWPHQTSWEVSVLVDKALYLQHFRFLTRTDDDAPSEFPNSTAKRQYLMEQRIRGTDKVMVRVHLRRHCSSSPLEGVNTGQCQHPINDTDHAERFTCVQWVIQKWVPARLFHSSIRKATRETRPHSLIPEKGDSTPNGCSQRKCSNASATTTTTTTTTPVRPRKKRKLVSSNVRYVGDGHDDDEQQVSNWRWLVARYHHWMALEDGNTLSAERLSGGVVGEVVKMDVMTASESADTLAMVTIRRLFLPEHTVSGRMWHHGENEIFRDMDDVHLQIPIEHLVMVTRSLSTTHGGDPGSDAVLFTTHYYSLSSDTYTPQQPPAESHRVCDTYKVCIQCRRRYANGVHWGNINDWNVCVSCADMLSGSPKSGSDRDHYHIVAGNRSANGRHEDALLVNELHAACAAAPRSIATEDSYFEAATRMLGSITVDFSLPLNFAALESIPVPQSKPSTKIKTPQPRKPKKGVATKSTGNKYAEKVNGFGKLIKDGDGRIDTEEYVSADQDYTRFQPTCAREMKYDRIRKQPKAEISSLVNIDKPRNLRDKKVPDANVGEVTCEDKSTSGRAARANQRRVLKDMASFGVTNSLTIDTLASRESQLRFDRSGIHAWGVYADADISAGEMIVEYRGEIIGNSIAEKREKEYEVAKIGSDYMFRIDATSVCDATKHGNVARFINASCGPNCFTKIITLDGNRRIVIYAKRNINAGEELCYDYKFPSEYDESKRIPCNCHAKECRGFMNWVRL